MAARLLPEQWQAIRTAWEYDPDEPSYDVAATRASQKHGFNAPAKSSISERAKRESWERRGSLSGINKAAHRKADGMVQSDGARVEPNEPNEPNAQPDASGAKKAQAAREESEDKRAEVIARHRNEWRQVAALRYEALQDRKANLDASFDRAKLAKITAEMTKIQQDGERKAWGLDDLGDFDPTRLTDEQLEKLARGG